jgi:hypothetical protein
VNFEKESSSIIQQHSSQQSQNGESFILDTAFKTTQVEWLFVSNRINHRVSYNKANIANIDMQFHYSGTFVDTSSILIADEFMGKQVVIITDGTDMFDFPFNTKTKKISVSF